MKTGVSLNLHTSVISADLDLVLIMSVNPGFGGQKFITIAIEKIKELIITIKGVGPQTALFIIVLTNGFTLFKNYRRFASYASIAPFSYASN